MSAEKRSVSAPADLFEQADKRAEKLRYSTFSAYVQALILEDVLQNGPHVRATGHSQAETLLGEAGDASNQQPPKVERPKLPKGKRRRDT